MEQEDSVHFVRFTDRAYGILYDKPPTSALLASVTGILCKVEGQKPLEVGGVLESDVAGSLVGSLVDGFVGPWWFMPSPWSSSVVDILHTIGLTEVVRLECYTVGGVVRDPLLVKKYSELTHEALGDFAAPVPMRRITDASGYNTAAGLGFSATELSVLEERAADLGRSLTDAEWFGLAQYYSEHCRHKIFNGQFVLEGIGADRTLFEWIKATTYGHTRGVVSAYADNVSFLHGPKGAVSQFVPTASGGVYGVLPVQAVIALKAETHNFPTTVEPFYGAGTGTGGELRDRLAGGRGSLPLAGTAVYMTSYTRMGEALHAWEGEARPWRYHSPADTLVKASNGASDYANKFGQPLVAGGVFTFEHNQGDQVYGYDKVVMLAGGVGLGLLGYADKLPPKVGDCIVVIGGDNYRIGLGGSTVSSTPTGTSTEQQEFGAVQRANPQMQRRIAKVIQACLYAKDNPIRSVHDHGAGGHMNCLVELLDTCGGVMYLDRFPIGDRRLSAWELLSNESQERMGLLIDADQLEAFVGYCKVEGVPCYVVGEVEDTDRVRFVLPAAQQTETDQYAVDLPLSFFHQPLPQRVLRPTERLREETRSVPDDERLMAYTWSVFALESVACKSWLVRKVDRCVGGGVAKQPTCGALQLPLNNVGVVALGFGEKVGIATALGHMAGLSVVHAVSAAQVGLVKSLSNLVFAPWADGIEGVSCSANWMWHERDYADLYAAVRAVSTYAQGLGITIPTGKDSLFMGQQYETTQVIAPGTVIFSSATSVSAIDRVIEPVLQAVDSVLVFVPLGLNFGLAGSAWAQTEGQLGGDVPVVFAPERLRVALTAIQHALQQGWLLSGHDISSGGLLTTLLEWCFPSLGIGLSVDMSFLPTATLTEGLFSETPGVVLQLPAAAAAAAQSHFQTQGVVHYVLGKGPTLADKPTLSVQYKGQTYVWEVDRARAVWYEAAERLDAKQTPAPLVAEQKDRLAKQPLSFTFPNDFNGACIHATRHTHGRIRAAVLRAPGSNSESEMAYALHAANFEVVDVPMHALITGEQTLDDVQFVAFAGGFSYADVLGAATGWAVTFTQNPRAYAALERFYARQDVLSFGACNGCQLMAQLGLIAPLATSPQLLPNRSKRFECHFVSVDILPSPAIVFAPLVGSRLGVWAAHGEGRFVFPSNNKAVLSARYQYADYPSNPNGSEQAAAAVCSPDGRHVAMMPHVERALFPYNWAHYPLERKHTDAFSPWIRLFEAAYAWLAKA